jgi:hypothetical protein
MATLLGHLAQFASFLSQGEVLCTQGLTYLLQEHPDARSAFAGELSVRAGVSINHDLTWHAEQRQSDGARPDLEAVLADNTPIVKIEAKLDAAFDPRQLRSYVSDLQKRLQSRRLDGILVVLVPTARTDQAVIVVKGEFALNGPGPWRVQEDGQPGVAIAVVSWDDMLAVLGRVESPRFHSELEQFEGMYRELRSTYIAPLAGLPDLIDWRNHEDDFVKLVDRVTRRLTTEHAVYPMGTDPPEQHSEGLEPRGYTRRYVCQPLGGAKETCLSIGVRDPFEGSSTPIWLRFNKTTGSFRDIRDRLESSQLAAKLRTSSGHIWIPLDIPFGVGSELMVDALVAQAEAVRHVAYPAVR